MADVTLKLTNWSIAHSMGDSKNVTLLLAEQFSLARRKLTSEGSTAMMCPPSAANRSVN